MPITSCPLDFGLRTHFKGFSRDRPRHQGRRPWINRIDVSKPDFLAREDLPPIRLPIQQIPPSLIIPLQQVPLEASVVTEEEIASSRLTLEEEIDQFCFVKDVGPYEKLVDISDSETESVNLSSVHPKQLIITRIDSESEEEKEEMD